jgi:chromosome segregation ATPase
MNRIAQLAAALVVMAVASPLPAAVTPASQIRKEVKQLNAIADRLEKQLPMWEQMQKDALKEYDDYQDSIRPLKDRVVELRRQVQAYRMLEKDTSDLEAQIAKIGNELKPTRDKARELGRAVEEAQRRTRYVKSAVKTLRAQAKDLERFHAWEKEQAAAR